MVNVHWQHGRQLAAMENSAQRIGFKYDHNGMRVEKIATIDGVTETTQYFYHGKKLMRQVKGNHVLHYPNFDAVEGNIQNGMV